MSEEYKGNTMHKDPVWVYNPLNNYPVNALCPCSSGKKYKKCCRFDMDRQIPKDEAEIYQEFIDEVPIG